MKSEVYSWRVSADTKAALEQAAHQEGTSVAALLDRMLADWLAARPGSVEDEAEQARLRRAAARTFGTIAGGSPQRAETVRIAMQRRLGRRYGRRRAN